MRFQCSIEFAWMKSHSRLTLARVWLDTVVHSCEPLSSDTQLMSSSKKNLIANLFHRTRQFTKPSHLMDTRDKFKLFRKRRIWHAQFEANLPLLSHFKNEIHLHAANKSFINLNWLTKLQWSEKWQICNWQTVHPYQLEKSLRSHSQQLVEKRAGLDLLLCHSIRVHTLKTCVIKEYSTHSKDLLFLFHYTKLTEWIGNLATHTMKKTTTLKWFSLSNSVRTSSRDIGLICTWAIMTNAV